MVGVVRAGALTAPEQRNYLLNQMQVPRAELAHPVLHPEIAQALGLGTIPQAALARHSGLIRRHFKLADDRKVVCGISFGYADHSHRVNSYRTSRASVADTVTYFD